MSKGFDKKQVIGFSSAVIRFFHGVCSFPGFEFIRYPLPN
jgi:hypothetical protein